MSLIYQCFFYDENTDVSDNMNIENLSIFRKIKNKDNFNCISRVIMTYF
mgnify:CR=1 FL=1